MVWLAGDTGLQAEGEGFEPSIRLTADNGFRDRTPEFEEAKNHALRLLAERHGKGRGVGPILSDK